MFSAAINKTEIITESCWAIIIILQEIKPIAKGLKESDGSARTEAKGIQVALTGSKNAKPRAYVCKLTDLELTEGIQVNVWGSAG